MHAIETIEHKGFTIKIYQDEDAQNPITDWDTLGTFVCWHRHYDLSNWQKRGYSFPKQEDFEEWRKDKSLVVLPLYLYDHSGISISTSASYPYNDPWDAGQVGYVFAERGKILKGWNRKLLTAKLRTKAVLCMVNEVEAFDNYLRGNVYGYVAEDPDGNEIDSCWGFFPGPKDTDLTDWYMVDEAKDAIEHEIKKAEETAIANG